MQPIVSIVLPVYNGEKYLTQSIESVLRQTYQNLELIIVNDCSTDSTEAIALSYQAKDDRIVYLKNEENIKLPASLNKGFAVAKGAYLSWTSDDNWYHLDAFDKMVAFLERSPDVGLVSFDYNFVNADGVFLERINVGETDELIFRNNVGACFLYRAEVMKEIGTYRTDLFLVEDYDYWLRISRKFKIAFCHEVLYEYRLHEKSLTEERKQEVRRILGEYQWNNLRLYEKTNMPEEQLFRFFDRIIDYKKGAVKKRLLMIGFGFRHWRYIWRVLKRNFCK